MGGCTQTCTLKHIRVGVWGVKATSELWGNQMWGQGPMAMMAGRAFEEPGTQQGFFSPQERGG